MPWSSKPKPCSRLSPADLSIIRSSRPVSTSTLKRPEGRGQQELIKGCLDRLGESPSTVKDLGAKLMAMGQGVSGMFVSDEVVKGAMAGYVFENLEIVSYTSLIAAAKAIGDTETQRACEQILPQEEAMAKWLLEHISELTTAFLERAANPDTEAKR